MRPQSWDADEVIVPVAAFHRLTMSLVRHTGGGRRPAAGKLRGSLPNAPINKCRLVGSLGCICKLLGGAAEPKVCQHGRKRERSVEFSLRTVPTNNKAVFAGGHTPR